MHRQTRARRTRAAMVAVERILDHIRSNLLGLVAIFIALGGTAYAVNGPLAGHNTVGSSDIINGEVKAHDIHTGAVRSSDVRQNALTGKDIREATLNLAEGPRAYGSVDPQACRSIPGRPDVCEVQEPTAGIGQVIRVGTGQYCVRATGIDASNTSAAVSVDWSDSQPNAGNAAAMTDSGKTCGGDGVSFTVKTERQPEVTVNQGNNGNNNATVSGLAQPDNSVGFTIVIP